MSTSSMILIFISISMEIEDFALLVEPKYVFTIVIRQLKRSTDLGSAYDEDP